MASSPAGSVTQRARGSKPDKAETTLRVGLRVTRARSTSLSRPSENTGEHFWAAAESGVNDGGAPMVEPKEPRSQEQIFADLCALVQEEGALHEMSAIFYRDWILTVNLQEAISDKVRRLINTFTTAFVFVQL